MIIFTTINYSRCVGLKQDHGLDISKDYVIEVTFGNPNIIKLDSIESTYVYFVPKDKESLIAEINTDDPVEINGKQREYKTIVTSLITDMSNLFKDNESFNGYIKHGIRQM